MGPLLASRSAGTAVDNLGKLGDDLGRRGWNGRSGRKRVLGDCRLSEKDADDT